ncbi:MAG: trypsin-like peptidase domain-containing protein [Nitratireductor sp.]|nr:trypsin-like peptidase domain-containing protein [Nitratireductor sp.]
MRWLALLLVLAAMAFAGGAAAQPFRGGAVSELEIVFPPPGIALAPEDAGDPAAGDLATDALVWAKTIRSPVSQGTEAPAQVRLRLSAIALPPGDGFRIEIADLRGRVYDTLDRPLLEGGGPVWTLGVPGTAASLRVRGGDAVEGLRFTIDRIAFPFDGKALESVFGQNDLMDIKDYTGIHLAAVQGVETSVARIDFVTALGGDVCTGFRIGADLVQTSSHCIADGVTCATASILFGYKKNAFNGIERGQQVRCVEVVAVDGAAGADTALLRVSPVPEAGYAVAALRGDDPVGDEPLFMVEHPGGEPKKLSIIDCHRLDTALTAQSADTFGHTCDTKGGASGAPIFDVAGLVVGQHRAGHDNPDITDQPNIATKGSRLVLAGGDPPAEPAMGIEPDPDQPPPGEAPIGTARPLPLPTAPPDVGRGTDVQADQGPSVSSPGSSGGGLPDTEN